MLLNRTRGIKRREDTGCLYRAACRWLHIAEDGLRGGTALYWAKHSTDQGPVRVHATIAYSGEIELFLTQCVSPEIPWEFWS